MRTLWIAVLLAAACGNTDNTTQPVPPPPSNDGGGFLFPDASPSGSDGGALGNDGGGGPISGRVCLAADPRALTEVISPTACASTGAGGLTVTLGDQTAMTADDGTFTIGSPGAATSSLMWHVEGAGIVPSNMLFSDYEIPALSVATMTALETDNGVTLVPGEGSIFVQVLREGAGDPAVAVTCTPTPDYGTFSDGATPTQWVHASTGGFGAAWCPGLDVGDGTATVKAQDGSTPPVILTSAAQPIEAGGITFVSLVFP